MPETSTERSPNSDFAESRNRLKERQSDRVRRFPRIVLIGYVALLLLLALAGYRQGPTIVLEDLLQPVDWTIAVLTSGLLTCAQFLLLGFLVTLSVGRPTTPLPVSASVRRWLWVLLPGVGLVALLSLIELGRPPGIASSLLPLFGYLAGFWIGSTCLRGFRATLWLVPKLLLVLLTLGAGAAGLGLLAIDEAPLSFEPPEVTSAEKRRLATVIEARRSLDNGREQLCISERDINLLLAMAMQETFPDGKARIALDNQEVRADLSAKVADSPSSRRYVNVRATCRAGITAGRLEIRFTHCRIGRVRVPRLLLDIVSTELTSAILDDPDVEHVLAAIDSVSLRPDAVETVFRSGDLSGEVISSLVARLGQKPQDLERTQIHIRHLVVTAQNMPGDDRFAAFLQAAFQLARQRSEAEDPVLENRAAILALAILLGHWRVESLVGPVTDQDLRMAARRRIGRVTLRNREDWRKHFFVSAALALISSESLSDAVGLLKEELDAGERGSGFSFCDLLADRAGTLFALAATGDRQSARRMQDRLADGFEVDELFPSAADLPEGIPDRRLQGEYGGVGGRKYNEVIVEIERRLAACAALR